MTNDQHPLTPSPTCPYIVHPAHPNLTARHFGAIFHCSARLFRTLRIDWLELIKKGGSECSAYASPRRAIGGLLTKRGDVVNTANLGSDFRGQVLQATDIVELIGQNVALKRRGKDYLGLCPFHQEKTPSFHVSPAKQFFHCFGCKASGNAIDFVMKRDRIEFIEALKLLGQRAGIEMPKFGVSKQKTGERQMLLEAQSAACSLFEKSLSHPQDGLAARQYFEKRGFTPETLRRFQVGLAPDAWDALLRPLVRKFTPDQLALAGLVKPRENGGGYYDTFRNRLMFPIRDENARIIAFGGRVMPGSDDKAKYLNSPETPLFSKSRCVFGLDLARQRIVETRTVAVVEGYTDVMMAHQYGVTNVVSILGTAMTPDHVSILRRFADRIVLLFDADTAGDKAADRSVELFLTQPVEIHIASMPPGIDPDEYLLQHGAQGFEQLLTNATDALSYKWKQLAQRFASGDGDLTAQQRAVEEYLEMLSAARGSGPVDSLRWGAALTRVSRLTQIPVAQLNQRFRTTRPSPKRPQTQPQDDNLPATQPPPPLRTNTSRDRAEGWILGVLLIEPHRWHQIQHQVQAEDFHTPLHRRLAEIYWNHQRDEGEPVFNEFLGLLDDPALTELAVELVDKTAEFEELDQMFADAILHLAQERQRQEEQKLVAELRRTTDVQLPEQDEVDLLKRLQEKARQPDLRRIGS